jgi:hypothetical protein
MDLCPFENGLAVIAIPEGMANAVATLELITERRAQWLCLAAARLLHS